MASVVERGIGNHNDVGISELQGEKELLNVLAEKEPTFAEVNHFLAEFRSACQNDIFRNFATGCSPADIEGRLWEMHVKINTRFRKLLSRFRDGGKKRPVEKRKLEKHYLNFIKTSQRFYCGYIQGLLARFDGIPELERVAREFNFENLSVEAPVEMTDDLRKNVLVSCHSTLIRLGDLSRYYEMELVPATKSRNWGRAIGYYNLASTINPESGVSDNQLAVIALADGNHLQATYHLYRALSAREPYPTSSGNLEIEFRKILSAWAKGELGSASGDEKASLISWFIYLHAQCYKGLDFPEHDELENEILSQLAVDLKEQSLEVDLLQKFCLINMAAEDYARARLKRGNLGSEEEFTQASQLFFRRLNVKTFFTLLQVLLAELECSAVANESAKATVVAQCILPSLRHYSSWLLANSGSLISETKDTQLYVQIKEFWKIYANTLTLLTSTFDVASLPEVDYLLDEDEDTLSFGPFINEVTLRRYVNEQGHMKPRSYDGVKRHYHDVEMLFRIREFVIDGLDLVVHEKIPIVLADDNDTKVFVYQEEGLPQFSRLSGHHHTLSSTSVEREDIPPEEIGHALVEDGTSQSASASVSVAMNRMVDALVESETADSGPLDDGILSVSPNYLGTRFDASVGQQDRDRVENGFSTFPAQSPITGLDPALSYSPRPALPSILNTPFAPQPGDAMSPQTRPATARQGSPRSFSMTKSNSLSHDQGPTYAAFQQGLFPSTPGDASTSSWSVTQNETYRTPRHPHDGGYLSRQPLSGPFDRAAYPGMGHFAFSSPFSYAYDSSGNLAQTTPPSGQGG